MKEQVMKRWHTSMNHQRALPFPLIVLAILSAVGGFMGVPEALHGSHWLNGYLAPVFAPSTELVEHVHLESFDRIRLYGRYRSRRR